MAQEAYRKGDRVFVVHERRGGYIYGHHQNVNDTFVPFSSFTKWPEAMFEAEIKADGVTRVVGEKFNFAPPEETTARLRAELAR